MQFGKRHNVGAGAWLRIEMTPKATKCSEITQNNGHCYVEGHSRSLILVPVESLYATSYE